MLVAGVDGCRAGWIRFAVEVASLATSLDLIDLPELLRNRPADLACLAIDIPIGLLDGSRACDNAARALLGQPRGTSVFATPCRAALAAKSHVEASEINRQKTTRGLSQQAWGIARKIKQIDDVITSDCQGWAFEVHPEVCFWALNERHPMQYNKKTKHGVAERIALVRRVFGQIETHVANRPRGVGADDLLDAAAATWTALRWHRHEVECICTPELDQMGLSTTIYY